MESIIFILNLFRVLDFIIKFPAKFSHNQKEIKEFTQEDAFDIENYLKDHIEINFFQLKDSKKIDDQYFNENYVKQSTEKPFFDYSVCAFTTMLKFLKKLEIQSLISKDTDLLMNQDEGIISEKKLNCYLEKMNKQISFHPKNLIDYFIQSHIQRISQELYNTEMLVANNYEIENNLCFSLFMVKKIIKDFSFYFEKEN